MNFAIGFIFIVLSSLVTRTNGRPSADQNDPMAGSVFVFEDGSRVPPNQIPSKIQGTCRLHKASMDNGLNKIRANICGGSCDSSKDNCGACQPTPSGKKPMQVDLKNKDGSTVTKTYELITECECAILKCEA